MVSHLCDCDRIDDMGDNPRGAVFANLRFERRPRSGELMHFSQRRETHIIRDRGTNGICSHDLSLLVYRLGCGNPVHAHGTVVLRLELLDCAVKPHHLNSQ
ncbi:MAG: hypothetical protein JO320_05960 [Alphaproteobacteria bacterium]|nr:hypothetical protein [Alphaproteobacteria bacterium]MBV9814786.1 hypothetical protein [Alphaproteobacteria bacterium]